MRDHMGLMWLLPMIAVGMLMIAIIGPELYYEYFTESWFEEGYIENVDYVGGGFFSKSKTIIKLKKDNETHSLPLEMTHDILIGRYAILELKDSSQGLKLVKIEYKTLEV